MRFWKPPGFVQQLEGGGKNKTKKKKSEKWPRFCPFHKSQKLSHLLFFFPLPANVVHWCVMEGRVHAQSDEFGHSWVNTHADTHTEKQQQMFQSPDH